MAKWPYCTSRWQQLRRVKLSTNPLCEHCIMIDVLTIADTVDHLVPISKGGEPFPPLEMLNSLCSSCHSAKTARGEEAGAVKTRKPRRGCTVDGRPLDASHPWHPASASNEIAQSKRAGTGGVSENIVSLDRGEREWV